MEVTLKTEMITHGCFISMYDKIHYNKKKKQKKTEMIKASVDSFSFESFMTTC